MHKQRKVRGVFVVRMSLGLDKNWFAQALSLTPAQYARYEAGKLELNPETKTLKLSYIASLLNVPYPFLDKVMSYSVAKRLIGGFRKRLYNKLIANTKLVAFRTRLYMHVKKLSSYRRQYRQFLKQISKYFKKEGNEHELGEAESN